MEREILLDGEMIRYEFRRKKVKNLNLRIRADGSVVVSAGMRVPVEAVEEFLRSKKKFLMAAIKKIAEQQEREMRLKSEDRIPYLGGALVLEFKKGAKYRADLEGSLLRLSLRSPEDETARNAALERWKREACERIAAALLDKWYPILQPYGVPLPRLRFRSMSSRWGSCIPKKNVVTLNTGLLAMPEEYMEYVLIHELVHFLQPDHSAAFYAWMNRFLPDWRERRGELRKAK